MFEHLKKAIKLVKKTGDKIIFFDSQSPEDTVLIMDLDQYEKMATNSQNKAPKEGGDNNLTDEDLADTINREILMWKNQENSKFLDEESKPRQAWKIPPEVKSGASQVE